MRIFLPLLALLLPAAGTAQVVINEFDVENPGLDPAEFIELYGPAGYALDGMCIVLYNGLNDLSYRTFALDGYALGAAGYFVVGGPQVAAAGLVVPEGNFLQPGTDAIALYATPASAYPVGSPLLSEDLLDAVVYGTNSPLDAILLNILTPGAVQVNRRVACPTSMRMRAFRTVVRRLLLRPLFSKRRHRECRTSSCATAGRLNRRTRTSKRFARMRR